MISKVKLLEKKLNYLLVFLFPTQLALHLWPPFSFIFGIRIDYYSITIYFTDILFLSLFFLWVITTRKERIKDLKRNIHLLIPFAILILINVFFSKVFFLSFFKWLKIIELFFLSYYVSKRTDIFNLKAILKCLLISLSTFSFIGIIQVINGHTTDNVFYLFGERSFSIFTPGISIINIFNQNILRLYSTFPHPNSFAGFATLCLIFIIGYKKNILSFVDRVLLFIIFFATVMTFSLSSLIGLSTVILFILLFKKYIFEKKTYNLLLIFYFFISLGLCIFADKIISLHVVISQSFVERLQLVNISGKLFSDNWLFGTGLNTFIKSETLLSVKRNGVWLLQPVHNVYLLILVETGLIGITAFSIILEKYILKLIKNKNIVTLIILVFILTTSLFDHYWFTINQNLLIIAFTLGFSLQEN